MNEQRPVELTSQDRDLMDAWGPKEENLCIEDGYNSCSYATVSVSNLFFF